MANTRGCMCASLYVLDLGHSLPCYISDIFITLNAMRALSIISLLLLIASSIVAMVDDVKAVNSFIAAGKTDSSSGNSTAIDCSVVDCDYIEYVLFTSFLCMS